MWELISSPWAYLPLVGLGSFFLGMVTIALLQVPRWGSLEEVPGPPGAGFCFLCRLSVRAEDRRSHDAVCPGLLKRRRLPGQRVTLVVFREPGGLRVVKVVGPFAFFGLEVSEISHGNGAEGVRRALEQVGAEIRE